MKLILKHQKLTLELQIFSKLKYLFILEIWVTHLYPIKYF